MQEVYVYPRLQHRRIHPLRVLLLLLPGILALWLFASPVAKADDQIGDAVGSATDATTTTAGSATDAVDNTAASASQTVGNTADSATQTVNDTAGSATQTAGNTAASATHTVNDVVGSVGDGVRKTVRSATDVAHNTAGSAGQATGDLTGSPTPSLLGSSAVPLAAMRERHVPQMCAYIPSSMLSELALVSLTAVGGESIGNAAGSSNNGALGFAVPPGPTVPTVPIPGLGDVPVVAIVAFLAMMVLAIIAMKAWVNERPRQPAFLLDSGISREAEPEKRRAL